MRETRRVKKKTVNEGKNSKWGKIERLREKNSK